MTRYLIAAAAAVLLGSQAEAQIIISTGGNYQPAGVYMPYSSVVPVSGFYNSGYYSPYSTYSSGYYSPYRTYSSGYYSPGFNSYSPRSYNTGYYSNYRPAYGVYRGRGRW